MDLGYAPSPWMILPFVALLATIALAPLFFSAWWARRFPWVSFGLSAVTLGYYLFFLPGAAQQTVLHTSHEYLSFIALIGALFVVSGGIHIGVKGESTPRVNVIFLLVGALIANILGTTGASMLLIRPWLRMNRYRVTAHHVVFFIFIVSNVGGCLTPIGDPPLFLGYLKGIPFWWVAEHCWPMWALGVGILLAAFYGFDRVNYRRAPLAVREKQTSREEWRLEGLGNLFFLAVILAAVFLEKPVFLREALMVGAAIGSYFTTARRVHAANLFNFHPIREVAILFVGIFATMMPALDWLQLNAKSMGTPTAGLYYWASGSLSSVLDNAPTYLAFFKAILGTFIDPSVIEQVQHLVQSGATEPIGAGASEAVRDTLAILQRHHPEHVAARSVGVEEIEIAFLLGNGVLAKYIAAISVGAVFFGANTYIGNGPNFMVKAIADQAKVHTPSFLAYIWKFSVPVMLPMLAVVWWICFRR
jgi:Na+/H+ antiporter NhaD/arsenite permease-like protein